MSIAASFQKLLRFPLEKYIFYLLLLFLPTQFGKHLWPPFSYIEGIRIDYLSPTLYMTDVLIIFLFLFYLKNFFLKLKSRGNSKLPDEIRSFLAKQDRVKRFFLLLNYFILKPRLWTISVGVLLTGVFFSKSPLAGLYGFVKFIEFAFLGFYVSQKVKNKKEILAICLIFSIGILFESFLAIYQYLSQKSIGGIFYFLGERTFNSQTPGIANTSLNGELILRPYATFSHPNVLAGYLLIGMTIVISKLQLKSKIYEIFLGLSILSGTIALLLTMSRVAILIWLVFLFYLGSNYLLKILKFHYSKLLAFNFKLLILILVLVSIGSIGIFFVLSPIHFRFTNLKFNEESVVMRTELIKTSVFIIRDNPVLGTGIYNSLVNIPYYQELKTRLTFFYLQPVHNIFLLVAAETGIAGLTIFLLFIAKTFMNIKFQIANFKFQIFIIVLALGLFDHYLLTLQQGQLLFSFVLGLCWAKVKIDDKGKRRDNNN